MVGDITLLKIKERLEEVYIGCKFTVVDSVNGLEVIYSDLDYHGDEEFINNVIDIVSEYVSPDDLWRVVTKHEALDKVS